MFCKNHFYWGYYKFMVTFFQMSLEMMSLPRNITPSLSVQVTLHSYSEDERKRQVKFQNQINFRLNPHVHATGRKLGKILCPVTLTCQWIVVSCSLSVSWRKRR